MYVSILSYLMTTEFGLAKIVTKSTNICVNVSIEDICRGIFLAKISWYKIYVRPKNDGVRIFVISNSHHFGKKRES